MVQISREVNLSAPERRARIATPWPGAEVTVVERTGSTMDDCLALGLRGMPSGTAVVAGFQDRGRGRAPGRQWLSPPWESLLMTVLLRADDLGFPPSQLPLRAGLAVIRAIESAAGIAAALRWPNDALIAGRKVAGILCEARAGLALVGIGVNCLQRSFPPEIAQQAGSLLLATGRKVRPLELCPIVLVHLSDALGEADWRGEVERRLAGRGTHVRVEPIGAGAVIEGTVLGVDADGALLVRDEGGAIRRAAQGQISGSR
jgi:BirA family transcriptional regulator, biotin operon repressor / biotin---[acetyl-CoA-carboxylase] ligase